MATFLDNLFSPFTGSNYSDAANAQRAFLANQAAGVGQNIGAAQTGGLAALRSGQEGALGAIGRGIETARGDISASVDPALAALKGGQTQAAGALTGAVDPALAALRGGVETATGAYRPVSNLADLYSGYTGGASQASADALGLNGPEGIARSRAAFQTSPGYQFSLEQGLQGILRGANVGGMVAGGNTLRDVGVYATNAANQEWQNYLAGLRAREGLYAPLALSGYGTAAGGISNAALAGGTGAANIYTGTGSRLADLYSGTGRAGAGIYTGAGQSLADLAARGGLAAGGVYTGTAQSEADLMSRLAGLQTGYTQATQGPYASTYGAEAAAKTGGAANLWNLGLAGAKLAGGLGAFG